MNIVSVNLYDDELSCVQYYLREIAVIKIIYDEMAEHLYAELQSNRYFFTVLTLNNTLFCFI